MQRNRILELLLELLLALWTLVFELCLIALRLKPIENIDFQALRRRILELLLELLLALWTLVSDLCDLLWSCVSQAFWAAWTCPPFETFRNELVAALISWWDYVVAHLVAAAIVVLKIMIVLGVLVALSMCFLHCLGFRKRGVLRGSSAARYQSSNYRGNVPKGSTFARFQSQGAKGGGGYRSVGGTGSPSWH